MQNVKVLVATEYRVVLLGSQITGFFWAGFFDEAANRETLFCLGTHITMGTNTHLTETKVIPIITHSLPNNPQNSNINPTTHLSRI